MLCVIAVPCLAIMRAEMLEGMVPARLLDPSERFKTAQPFLVICQRCGTTGSITAPCSESSLCCSKAGCGGLWRSGFALAAAGAAAPGGAAPSLTPLPFPAPPAGSPVTRAELDFCLATLQNGLTLAVRKHIMEYSQHWMRCVVLCRLDVWLMGFFSVWLMLKLLLLCC